VCVCLGIVHVHTEHNTLPPVADTCPGTYLGMYLCMRPYLQNSYPVHSCLMSNLWIQAHCPPDMSLYVCMCRCVYVHLCIMYGSAIASSYLVRFAMSDCL
jgi:hypothetical protein